MVDRAGGMAAHSIGVWQQSADVHVARHLAGAGYDWVALDAQHGAIDRTALLQIARALSDLGATFVVRVPGVEPTWIGAALDAGAAGVVVPSVNTVDEVHAIVRASYYPPLGERSWGPFSLLWNAPAPDPTTANSQVQCAVMIETAPALAIVDQIAAVDGVDALFIGPYDLSLSLQTSIDRLLADDRPEAPIPTIVAAAARHAKTVLAFAGDLRRTRALHRLGVHGLAVTTDLGLLGLGSAQLVPQARADGSGAESR